MNGLFRSFSLLNFFSAIFFFERFRSLPCSIFLTLISLSACFEQSEGFVKQEFHFFDMLK